MTKLTVDDENQGQPLSIGSRKHNIPTVEDILALAGRITATLTEREQTVLKFFLAQGRKFGVAISIASDVDPDILAAARSKAEADEILKSANSVISVNKV